MKFVLFPLGKKQTGVFGVLFLILSLALLATGCSSGSQASSATTGETETTSTTRSKGPISEEKVTQIVERKLGETAAAGEPVIRKIALAPEGSGTFVAIDLNRSSSCHPGQLVGTVVDISKQVMSTLFRYPDVAKVQIALYGPTEDPKDKNVVAARVTMNKAAADKVLDWATLTSKNVESIVSEFWVEPTVYENWKSYGELAITDEALRAAANAAAAAPTTTTAP